MKNADQNKQEKKRKDFRKITICRGKKNNKIYQGDKRRYRNRETRRGFLGKQTFRYFERMFWTLTFWCQC